MEKKIPQTIKLERENQGLDIETVSRETFIPSKFLTAIENGDWECFPSRVHLKGFLKKYLDYLKIPSDTIVGLPDDATANPNQEITGIFVESHTPTVPVAWKILKVSILLLFGCVFSIFAVRFMRGDPAVISGNGRAQSPSPPIAARAGITFRACEDVWVRAECDGKVVLERVLRRGEAAPVNGEKIVLRMGNAAGLIIDCDGRTKGPFGGRGQVLDLVVDETLLSR